MRQIFVARIAHWIWITALCTSVAAPAAAANADLEGLLKGVENRYNRARTIQVQFEQTYTVPGRGKRTESGELSLRKPGRMRWDYRSPAGKLFISDGKDAYFYSPTAHRVEKMKLKETDDMRAPLAFLLGRLNFQRDFGRFETRIEGSETVIVAMPKSDKLPYRHVEFSVTPDHQIMRLVVTGQDQSIIEFRFTGEKVNPALSDNLFRFQMPPNVEYIDATESELGGN